MTCNGLNHLTRNFTTSTEGILKKMEKATTSLEYVKLLLKIDDRIHLEILKCVENKDGDRNKE